MKKELIIISFLIFCTSYLLADNLLFNGQASSWFLYTKQAQFGLRYIPQLDYIYPLGKDNELEGLASVNTYVDTPENSKETLTDYSDLQAYRLWVRYKTPDFEARIGLQQINFGQAKFLRSLMWFDQIDPNDPLALTHGVYGALLRYYFQNNVDLWAWGLYGNNNIKGNELFKTSEKRPEYGGRFEFPLLNGDSAISVNRRYVDPTDFANKTFRSLEDGSENRFAIDGNWDLGIGAWFETSMEQLKIDEANSLWHKLLTLGMDYTLLSGIHFTFEHYLNGIGNEVSTSYQIYHFSVLEADYPLTLLDTITGLSYYDWDNHKIYYFISWVRTYDNWKIYLMGFSIPQTILSTFSGTGIELQVVFNY